MRCRRQMIDRVTLGFMTDADLVRRSATDVRTLFATRFGESTHIKARFGTATPLTAPKACPAQTGGLSACTGTAWIAAGDAAVSFDPLSSLGMGHAMIIGIQVARVVEQIFAADATLCEIYAADIKVIRAAHHNRQMAFYKAERRWTCSTFWQRRHTSN